MLNCPFCNHEIIDASDLEEHLLEDHFLTMQSYYELKTLEDIVSKEDQQYRKNKYPLTYLDRSSYYLPNWNNISNYYEKKQTVSMIQSAILDYFNKVLEDRFLQMFLITDNYFNSTLSHTYDEFKEVLGEIHKKDRNKIWFLDWNPGYPKIISKDNLDGIKIVEADNRYDIKNTRQSIRINSWTINYPEIIPFDQRHHSRYNLFNLSRSSRETKRLRIKDEKDQCIKFFNNDNDYKSLFKITDSDGNNLVNKLSEQDLAVSKLLLLRNKSFMKLIIYMINEILKNINTLSDSVFLRNTVMINPDIKDKLNVNISWLPNKFKENYINISIL